MEFGEKLQALRKSRGLTQEELAEALFVSRTAVSKWESGRGYPSIDSLKEVSGFFSVSIDDLLSGEKLLSLAQREHTDHLRRVYGLLYGMTDLFSCLLILLPLYPQTADGFVYAVNLFAYRQASPLHRAVYWAAFVALTALGALGLLLLRLQKERPRRVVTACSAALSVVMVFFLALARQPYALTVVFSLLLAKAALLYRAGKTT
ncbi:MAG: helix-turn-helix transcriptional regulator [Clostridia bacterium]|nr:helix-turn-helix transcriptional regulator [Clostridia bacterium]